MVSNYADLIIMRHHLEGRPDMLRSLTRARDQRGDGANQHPTQTMLDLFTIYETQGTLEDLTITIVEISSTGAPCTPDSRLILFPTHLQLRGTG